MSSIRVPMTDEDTEEIQRECCFSGTIRKLFSSCLFDNEQDKTPTAVAYLPRPRQEEYSVSYFDVATKESDSESFQSIQVVHPKPKVFNAWQQLPNSVPENSVVTSFGHRSHHRSGKRPTGCTLTAIET